MGARGPGRVPRDRVPCVLAGRAAQRDADRRVRLLRPDPGGVVPRLDVPRAEPRDQPVHDLGDELPLRDQSRRQHVDAVARGARVADHRDLRSHRRIQPLHAACLFRVGGLDDVRPAALHEVVPGCVPRWSALRVLALRRQPGGRPPVRRVRADPAARRPRPRRAPQAAGEKRAGTG